MQIWPAVLVVWWTISNVIPAWMCWRYGQRTAAVAFLLAWVVFGAAMWYGWEFLLHYESDPSPDLIPGAGSGPY